MYNQKGCQVFLKIVMKKSLVRNDHATAGNRFNNFTLKV